MNSGRALKHDGKFCIDNWDVSVCYRISIMDFEEAGGWRFSIPRTWKHSAAGHCSNIGNGMVRLVLEPSFPFCCQLIGHGAWSKLYQPWVERRLDGIG